MRYLAWLWLLLCAAATAQPPPTFTINGTFRATDWQTTFHTAPGACANGLPGPCTNSETTSYVACANPHFGTCYQLALVDNTVAPITAVMLNTTATWDAGKNGPVQSFSFTEDLVGITSSAPFQGEGFGPAIQTSDGNVYVFTGTQSTPVPSLWVTVTLIVQATDLVLVDKTTGSVDSGTHPQPSELSSGTITFGFWVQYFSNPNRPASGTQQFGNWAVTVNSTGSSGASCQVIPPNRFMPFHREEFHERDPQRYPLHTLTVAVSANGAPAGGVPVTLTGSQPVFPAAPDEPPTIASAVANTDDTGQATFQFNPPNPAAFDETTFNVTGSANGASFSCAASIVVGIGALEGAIGRYLTNESIRTAVQPFEEHLFAFRKALMRDPSSIAGLRKTKRYGRAVRKILNWQPTALTGADLRAIRALVEKFSDAEDPEMRSALARLKEDFGDAEEQEKLTAALRRKPGTENSIPDYHSDYGQLPLAFEPADSQNGREVRFVARASGYNLYLTSREAVLLDRSATAASGGRAPVLRMRLAAGNIRPRLLAARELPGKSHYIRGSNPALWRTNVPQYEQVKYEGIYPGVDLVFHGRQRRIEFDFIVAPGASPANIVFSFQGVEQLDLDALGNLVLQRSTGALRLEKPVIYQEAGGIKKTTAGRYVLKGRNRVGFEVARYDPARPLIIDPVLSYASYLGGASDEFGSAVAVDSQGNAYITGSTASINFPTANALASNLSPPLSKNLDIFVTKLNAAGSAVVYSTYLGGSGDDVGMGIAVDSAGAAYLTGTTSSSDFPLMLPVQKTFGGGSPPIPADAFVLKLNAAGSGLVYSTYLGGSANETARSIAVDAAGNAYVTGLTSSTDFPVRNALQPANNGGTDAFLVKVNPAGNLFVYATYLGGVYSDIGYAVTVDAAGNAYVAGWTYSPDFPTANPLQPSNQGSADAFVAKINPAGSALVFSTYLGGQSDDLGMGIALDSNSNVYVAGTTGSANFPTLNAAQTQFGASNLLGADAFITKLKADGSALVYSTYLGGSGVDVGMAIAVGADGSAYVSGETASADFPVSSAIQQSGAGFDECFVAKLNPAGSAFDYATLLGGSGQDAGNSIALDASAAVYVVGSSTSADFPVTYGAFQTGNQGLTDALVMKIVAGTAQPRITTISAASLQAGGAVAAESIVSGFGSGLATSAEQAGTLPLPTVLAGSSVKVKDAAGTERLAPLFYASPGQVNYEIPEGTSNGLAAVTVISGSQVLAAGTVAVATVAPGLFSANSNGQGVAAGSSLKVGADQSRTSQPIFQCGAAGGCVPVPVDLGGPTDQVFLILFGTGIRGRSSLSAVTATVGNQTVNVGFAGPQGMVGLDQVNLGPLPPSLAGQGQVDVVLTVDSETANTVTVSFK